MEPVWKTSGARPFVFGGNDACLQSGLWYRRHVTGYRRPPSRSELRQMRRQRMRLVMFCGLALVFILGAVAGLIYLMYAFALR